MVGSCSDHSRNGLGSCSERSRIGRALEMTLQPFSANLSQILEGHFSWQAQYLVRLEATYVAPRIVNSVSCVKRIQHEIHFSWQAQYLVRLGDVACRTAHCK